MPAYQHTSTQPWLDLGIAKSDWDAIPDRKPTQYRRMRSTDREKTFGPGRCIPLDRNAKVRLMMLARALSRRTEPGKAYGIVTAKALAVLQALLWRFHNAASGRCFPSYEAIAEAAGCARSTVAAAIHMLERAGIMTWVNRIKRIREYVPGLFGNASATRWRVIRTSNGYAFTDPMASKSDLPTGTPTQVDSSKNLNRRGHDFGLQQVGKFTNKPVQQYSSAPTQR